MPKKNTTVLHHADADGFGAAFAVHEAIDHNVIAYIPVQYGQPVPEIPDGTEVLYVVDFSYAREICEELAAKYDLRILDHHKTAESALEGLPYAEFDVSKSGCRMAWEHFYPSDTNIPEILQYVEDRDLWKFEMPLSEEVNMYIASLPWDFEVWREFSIEKAMTAGVAIKSFRDSQIKSALKSVRMMSIEVCEGLAYEVPVVNASDNISELGNVMCNEYPNAPFSASYCDRKDKRSWSLRSIGAFDVSDIAKEFGGGGHKNAAGFTTDLFWPQSNTEAFIKSFEEVE